MSAAAVSAPAPEDVIKSSSNPTRRGFFGLGKKKEKTSSMPTSEPEGKIVSEKAPQLPELVSVPPMNSTPPAAFVSPPKRTSPQSPNRSLYPASSPILAPRPTTAPSYPSNSPPRLSTSSSQIFERNVQEHVGAASLAPTSTAIPSHIQTDNHIPPVLEASSIAITDKDCGVDEVQIVTSAMHQPAVSVVVPSASTSPIENTSPNPLRRGSATEASDYSGDEMSFIADKRRLSFISFADVVQAEQTALADHSASYTSSPSRGSPVHAPIDPIAISTITETLRRSPSPIRGGLGGSPPNMVLGGSFTSSGSPSRSGDNLGVERSEVTIETMRQALRRTGSGELAPRSPVATKLT